MQFGTEEHIRIHWGMFGIYYLNRERPGKEPTAVLHFSRDRVLRLYSVSLRVIPGVPSAYEYDPRADVMNTQWNSALALEKLRALPSDAMICDALLNQEIFAGVGNAIKTEALFARSVHPESHVHVLPPEVLEALVEETAGQSQLFLEGKRAYGSERYGWTLAYRRKVCPRCRGQITTGSTGVLQRKSHWCVACAVCYR
jgi:endonuclease-8